jgi:hypothetical protein
LTVVVNRPGPVAQHSAAPARDYRLDFRDDCKRNARWRIAPNIQACWKVQ